MKTRSIRGPRTLHAFCHTRWPLRLVFVMTLSLAVLPSPLPAQEARASAEYPDFYTGEAGTTKGIDFVQSISVLAPAYCSNVKGDVTVVFRAPGMVHAKAWCWRQPTTERPGEWGHDALLADLELNENAEASFVFRADQFPNGPTVIRIQAKDDRNRQDLCELQLFNLGGVVWNQGIPDADPPGARGMKLVFADDFEGPLSISSDGRGARYAAHKTGGGDFSGWQFSDPLAENEPFGQRGSFLRIHASKPLGTKGRSGILSSLRSDGTGVCVPIPSYFECRFVAQSAPGTWPAFWTLTKGTVGLDKKDPSHGIVAAMGTDELDIIEAYGGYGPRNPNSGGFYSSVSHFWRQPKPDWNESKLPDGSPNPRFRPSSFRTDTLKLGGKSSWSWTFHTYGLAITETDTIYYFDNIEVGRHPTGPTSKAQPAWFLINYAIGGISGWQIDMERYGNKTDMWVDFVRVYSGRTQAPEIHVDGFVGARPATVTLSCVTEGAIIRYTVDGAEPTAGSARYDGPFAMDKPGTVRAVAAADGLTASLPSEARVSTPPGIPGSIGVNFVGENSSEQRLGRSDAAGIGNERQANWNHVVIGEPAPASLVTADGTVAEGVALAVSGDAKVGRAEHWGFTGTDLKLQRGCIQPAPEITVSGIRHGDYDVVVYLAAGVHSTKGSVTIAMPQGARGTVDPAGTYHFDYNWQAGKHVQATRTAVAAGGSAAGANCVRFVANTADSFVLRLKTASGGWSGISAIQIIPRR